MTLVAQCLNRYIMCVVFSTSLSGEENWGDRARSKIDGHFWRRIDQFKNENPGGRIVSVLQLLKPNSTEAFMMASSANTSTTVQQSFSLPVSAQVGIGILSLAFILGFPGNLFVVWSVFCRVKKRSVTCLLVLNLAMADAFVLLSAPLFIRYLSSLDWEFGSAACKLVHYLSNVNMYVSIYLICLMSMDRWLAVTRPFLSQRMRTKRSLMVLLLTVWVLAFLLSLPMPFYRSIINKPIGHNITLRFCSLYHWNSNGHQVFQYVFETTMGCVVPFSLVSSCYSSVLCRLQNAKFQRRAQGSRLILLIISAFAVFWLPYHIVNIIEVAGLLQNSTSVTQAAATARPNVTAFAYFSSAVNPILYVFAGSSHIRQAGLSFMGRLFEATNSESRSTSTFTRSGRSSSSPDESSVLHTLSVKLGKPFKGKNKERSCSVAGREADAPELKTLATADLGI
ncbi:leukotriene B4 receptor 1 isoform X2 [Mugil cephalus]|uniref:leukotriene B4 receptor 1 isoform X2 n=1 Tax=Mugil cephalus TaxID=48193 RepID=UPI001FB63254|nr:leukotriene B4 receptor 1 isoform X2 [Mugil cephalus]